MKIKYKKIKTRIKILIQPSWLLTEAWIRAVGKEKKKKTLANTESTWFLSGRVLPHRHHRRGGGRGGGPSFQRPSSLSVRKSLDREWVDKWKTPYPLLSFTPNPNQPNPIGTKATFLLSWLSLSIRGHKSGLRHYCGLDVKISLFDRSAKHAAEKKRLAPDTGMSCPLLMAANM